MDSFEVKENKKAYLFTAFLCLFCQIMLYLGGFNLPWLILAIITPQAYCLFIFFNPKTRFALKITTDNIISGNTQFKRDEIISIKVRHDNEHGEYSMSAGIYISSINKNKFIARDKLQSRKNWKLMLETFEALNYSVEIID